MSVKLDRLGHIFTEAISKIINEQYYWQSINKQ